MPNRFHIPLRTGTNPSLFETKLRKLRPVAHALGCSMGCKTVPHALANPTMIGISVGIRDEGAQEVPILGGLIWGSIVELIAGWLVGKVMKGRGFGVLMDIVLGLVGAVVGGWLFSRLGSFPFGGILGTIVMVFVDAVIFLWLTSIVKKAQPPRLLQRTSQ